MGRMHEYPRTDGPTVPRPFHRWIHAILVERSWRNTRRGDDWYPAARRLADDWRCRLRIDARWHWQESLYHKDYEGKGPCLLVGGAGESACVCTALLHELGHHILETRREHPAEVVRAEEAAWAIALALAARHRLPLVASLRRQALYSYRYARECELARGSKRRAKRPRCATVDRLRGSSRSAAVGRTDQERPVGRKGKRKYKKETKKRTARHERRTRERLIE